MIVLDAHCDSPSQMLRLRDFGQDNRRGQVDFPKMKRGGVDASFFSLYIAPCRGIGADALRYADSLLDTVDRQVAENPDKVVYAYTKAQVEANADNGLISILLGLENGSPVGEDLKLVDYFYERGVRYITLTHSADNQICDSCTGKGTWGGLSPFGRQMVRHMEELGMMIDLAHSSDDTVRDVLSCCSRPVVYTHGCCRTLASHRRNLSDELLLGIAETGGVAGMSIYPDFLDDGFAEVLRSSGLDRKLWLEDEFIKDPADPAKSKAWYDLQEELTTLKRPGVGRVVDHIEHALAVCGEDHVGIGTDYDGIEYTASGLETIASFACIFTEMRRRNIPESVISKVAGRNFLRLL